MKHSYNTIGVDSRNSPSGGYIPAPGSAHHV